jgi:hypothetical protein
MKRSSSSPSHCSLPGRITPSHVMQLVSVTIVGSIAPLLGCCCLRGRGEGQIQQQRPRQAERGPTVGVSARRGRLGQRGARGRAEAGKLHVRRRHRHHAGLGWAALRWAGLGWAGLGWARLRRVMGIWAILRRILAVMSLDALAPEAISNMAMKRGRDDDPHWGPGPGGPGGSPGFRGGPGPGPPPPWARGPPPPRHGWDDHPRGCACDEPRRGRGRCAPPPLLRPPPPRWRAARCMPHAQIRRDRGQPLPGS